MIKFSQIISTLLLYIIVQIALSTGLLDRVQNLRLINVTIIFQNDKAADTLYTTKKTIEESTDIRQFKMKNSDYIALNHKSKETIYKVEKIDSPNFFDALNRSRKIKWLYYISLVSVGFGFFFMIRKYGTFFSLGVTFISAIAYTLLSWTIISDLDMIGWNGVLLFCGVGYIIKFFYITLSIK